MSEYIYANIVRGGSTTIATNIRMQLDKMDAKEASFYKGADPHFTYRMFTQQLPVNNATLVQQSDHVVDQAVIDPKTGAGRKYLIISDPQPKTLMMTWQWIAVRMRGT